MKDSAFGRWIVLLLTLSLLLLTGCDRTRNRAVILKNEAIHLYEGGNYTGALSRLSEAVSVDPTYGEAYYIAGMIRLQQYDSPETAIPDLEQAAELMPDHAPSFYLLGSAYLRDGNHEAAVTNLSLATEKDPEHARAYFRLGTAYEATGDVMAAIDAFTHSIHAEPRFPQPYEHLGNIYGLYDHVDEAIAVFSESLENCGDPNSANNLGRMYQRNGEIEAAIQNFQLAVTARPDSVAYNYNLGVAYTEAYQSSHDRQDRDRATEYLTIAGNQCAALGSQARCNEIQQSLQELADSETQ